jgi:hypothetical protein
MRRISFAILGIILIAALGIYVFLHLPFWRMELALRDPAFQKDLLIAARKLTSEAPTADSITLLMGDHRIPTVIERLHPKQILIFPSVIGIETNDGYKIICENRAYRNGFSWDLYREDSSGPVEHYLEPQEAEQDAAANP